MFNVSNNKRGGPIHESTQGSENCQKGLGMKTFQLPYSTKTKYQITRFKQQAIIISGSLWGWAGCSSLFDFSPY